MSMTSVIRYAEALDTSTSEGKIGLVFGDVTAKYLTQGGTLTSLTTEDITTLGTYQAPTSAAHIRIKELAGSDPTKGIYEVHFHNTQVLSAGSKLWLFLSAAGAKFQPLELELVTPSKAGDKMDLIDAPNSTAITAFVTAFLAGVVDGTITVAQALEGLAATFGGKWTRTTGSGNITYVFRNAADTKDIFTLVYNEASGDRTTVTLNL